MKADLKAEVVGIVAARRDAARLNVANAPNFAGLAGHLRNSRPDQLGGDARKRPMSPMRFGFWGMSAEFAALVRYFQQHGFEAVRRDPEPNADAEDEGFDLVVVEADGAMDEALRVCRRSAAQGGVPVVVVAPNLDEDAVAALEAGAADVLARPLSPREALARVRSVLRRRHARPLSMAPGWAFGDWILEAERHVLRTPGGKDVVLPLGEFALLRGFVDQPLSILSRDDLKNLASAVEAVLDARVMDVRISRLRARFGGGLGHKVIETVRGEGYRFALPVRALNPTTD